MRVYDYDKFEPIELGNLDIQRDWSHALDFMDGIWKMLNQEKYNDMELLYVKQNDHNEIVSRIKEYVLASGKSHSLREFVEQAFKCAGFLVGGWVNMDVWGQPLSSEKETLCVYDYDKNGKVRASYPHTVVRINPKFYRPAEVETLCGNSSLIRKELGWKPKISFDDLVCRMVDWDIKHYEN